MVQNQGGGTSNPGNDTGMDHVITAVVYPTGTAFNT